MRKLICLAAFCLLGYATVQAQSQYYIQKDTVSGGHLLKGIISRDVLTQDSTFTWWKENFVPYAKDNQHVQKFAANSKDVELVVFMGTWCSDSHYIIPRLFSFLDAAGFNSNRVTLIATDRAKTTISHLTQAFGITNVPTIMVMKDGKEKGRVVEYGKTGVAEAELADITAMP